MSEANYLPVEQCSRPSHPGNEEHGIRYAIGGKHMRKMAYSSHLLQETET